MNALYLRGAGGVGRGVRGVCVWVCVCVCGGGGAKGRGRGKTRDLSLRNSKAEIWYHIPEVKIDCSFRDSNLRPPKQMMSAFSQNVPALAKY